MKTLVGIPVFRVRNLTCLSLNSTLGTPSDLLIVDNAADQDIKELLNEQFVGKAHIITNPINSFCNGGWNQTMQYGLENNYDIVGLGSSDVQLHPGWYELLMVRAAAYTDEVWVPKVGPPQTGINSNNAEHVYGGVAGFFTFLPRKAVEVVYPIPSQYKHWFGDQYMFEKLRHEGWKVTILHDMLAYHQQSAITSATPEAYEQIERDKVAWYSGDS